MRTSLFLAAAVCMIAAVNAATIVQMNMFADDNGCTGTPSFQTNYTVGDCSYKSSYFALADGSKIYIATYDDATCAAASLKSVTEITPGCNTYAGRKISYTVVDAGTAPAFGTFPPTGFSTSTSYYNQTSGSAATACAAGTGIITYQSASAQAGCTKRTTMSGGSTNSYCTADGAYSGSAIFSDAACATLVSATLTPVGCVNGVQTSCSGVATFPTLPNQGIITYDDKDTACAGSVKSTTLQVQTTCVDSTTFVCGANANVTNSATFTTFTDSTGMGLCTGANVTVASTNTLTVDTCTNAQKYTCSYTPGSLGSASTASASALVLLAAAVSALFATRSL